jgi:5'-3' exonuclease
MQEWSRHILDDRVTFDEAWTKMGLHHGVPRTQLIDEVLAAAKHFQRATSDYVFPSPKTGGQMSGFTKMVARLIKEASPDAQAPKHSCIISTIEREKSPFASFDGTSGEKRDHAVDHASRPCNAGKRNNLSPWSR